MQFDVKGWRWRLRERSLSLKEWGLRGGGGAGGG